MDSDGQPTVSLSMTGLGWHDVIDEPLALAERLVRATLMAGTTNPCLRASEVSILLTHDQEIKSLNAIYRDKDQTTNVLSFPSLDLEAGSMVSGLDVTGDLLLGDVIMSKQRVLAEASDLGKEPLDHFAHLLVHGMLHLLGYDHGDDAEAAVMESLEASILKSQGFAQPYETHQDLDVREAVSMDAAP